MSAALVGALATGAAALTAVIVTIAVGVRRRRRRLPERPAGRTAVLVHKAIGDLAYVERQHALECRAVEHLRWVPDRRGGWRLAGEYLPPLDAVPTARPRRAGRFGRR